MGSSRTNYEHQPLIIFLGCQGGHGCTGVQGDRGNRVEGGARTIGREGIERRNCLYSREARTFLGMEPTKILKVFTVKTQHFGLNIDKYLPQILETSFNGIFVISNCAAGEKYKPPTF